MPQRMELREQSGGYIGGVPFAVAHARGSRLVAFVATFDADGLMETLEDCQSAAARFRVKLDKCSKKGNDADSGVEKPGISQGS